MADIGAGVKDKAHLAKGFLIEGQDVAAYYKNAILGVIPSNKLSDYKWTMPGPDGDNAAALSTELSTNFSKLESNVTTTTGGAVKNKLITASTLVTVLTNIAKVFTRCRKYKLQENYKHITTVTPSGGSTSEWVTNDIDNGATHPTFLPATSSKTSYNAADNSSSGITKSPNDANNVKTLSPVNDGVIKGKALTATSLKNFIDSLAAKLKEETTNGKVIVYCQHKPDKTTTTCQCYSACDGRSRR